MLSALGPLLPIAVAVAVSTVPIMATILILLSPKRNQSAIPFLIGWVVGMAAVVVIAAIGANALPIRPFRAQQKAIAIGQIVVGTALTRRCGDGLATGGPGPSGQRERVARSSRPDGTCAPP